MVHYSRAHPSVRKSSNLFSWISNLNVTGWLILANIVCFIMVVLLGKSIDVNNLLALQANNLINNGYYWTLLTSIFMHAGFFHLFVNMFSLFFIGRFLEMLIGKRRFFWLYLLSGIFAGLFFAVLSYLFGGGELGKMIFTSPSTYAVGASGALFAIAGVLAFLTPRNRVYLIAGPLIAIVIQAVLDSFVASPVILNIAGFLITLYILISIFMMVSLNPRIQKIAVPVAMPFWMLPIVAIVPLVIIGLFVELPIGNMAHLGGFLAGAFYGIYLRMRYRRKTKIISEYFS